MVLAGPSSSAASSSAHILLAEWTYSERALFLGDLIYGASPGHLVDVAEAGPRWRRCACWRRAWSSSSPTSVCGWRVSIRPMSPEEIGEITCGGLRSTAVVGRGGRRLVVEVARCQPFLRRALRLLVHRGHGRRDYARRRSR